MQANIEYKIINNAEYAIRPVVYFLTVKKDYTIRFGGDLALQLQKDCENGDNQLLFFNINNKLEFMAINNADCNQDMITELKIYATESDNKIKENKKCISVVTKATKIIKKFGLEAGRYEVVKTSNTNALFNILI